MYVPCQSKYDILGYHKVVKVYHIKDDVKPVLRTFPTLHSQKRTTCSGLMKTALNSVLLPTLSKLTSLGTTSLAISCNNVEQYFDRAAKHSPMLFHQAGTDCPFFAVYWQRRPC